MLGRAHIGEKKCMRPVSILFLVSFILTACNPVSLWYRQGAEVGKLNSDLTNCRVRAAQAVPVNQQIRRTPTYVSPVQTNCYGTGYSMQCYSTGGNVTGGNIYSFDANSGLRTDVISQCMGQQGYQLVEFPQCDSSGAAQATNYSRLPAISPNSCVAKVSGDSWVVVNPGG